MAEPALRLVSETDKAPVLPWPESGEALTIDQALHRLRDLIDERDGLTTLTRKLARENAGLQRRIIEEADPNSHPRGAEIVALVERWKRGAKKPTAKVGAARVKLVKARLADGFSLSADDWLPAEPTLELAVDGLCAYPFRVYDNRFREGKKATLDNDLKAALKDEQHVEDCARLGYKARKDGLVTWGES